MVKPNLIESKEEGRGTDVVAKAHSYIESIRRSKAEPRWMLDIRDRAFDIFSHTDWPTTQEEEWRRTDLSSIHFQNYRLVSPNGKEATVQQAECRVNHEVLRTTEGYGGILRFRGTECTHLSLDKKIHGRGVFLLPLHQAVKDFPDTLQSLFNEEIGEGIGVAQNRLQTWHYSLWSHGAYLYVPPFVEIDEPLLIDFTEAGEMTLSSPHVVAFLDRGARAVVVQRIKSRAEEESLFNSGAHVHVSESAGLSYYEVQSVNQKSLYFSHGTAKVDRDASLLHFDVAFGSRLAKTRFDCSLNGSGSEVMMNGIYFAHKQQHMDIRSVQRHVAPLANSRAFYKGAVKEKAKTIFQGLIEVTPAASKTDAYLTNKNLILNNGARADSIPSLKIDTNDVKCSHGSTTGKIDEEELFYLMSRGLSRAEAERMLVLGYFEEVMQQAPEVVLADLRFLIEERLADGSSGEMNG